jgi:CBS domain-containing protein
MQKTVGQLLEAKGTEVWTIGPDETVLDALNLLAEKNIGAVVVVENGKVCGILSERDYARKIRLQDRDSKETAVRAIMTPSVRTVTRDQDVDHCMEIMTDYHIRHLPVVDGEALVGVISVGDVVKAVMAEQAFLIEQLHQYITG